MSIKAGLVGLPNVGKSTLFNALTKSGVPAENYPFCTIDPHVAITEVPDERIQKLAAIYGSAKLIPATVTFVDIAGLVKGAASGEGLGNQFLSHIREVDLILHVLRCFESNDIVRNEAVDPITDYEIILDELMIKDLESVDKRLERMPKLIKTAQGKPNEIKDLTSELELLEKAKSLLEKRDATALRELFQKSDVKTVPLIAPKNFLVIANIAEHELEQDAYLKNPHYNALIKHFGADKVIPVCARTEYELSQMAEEDAQEMMAMVGLKEPSLHKIIRESYANLGLITFFTCGPKEAHAWPIRKGITVRQAAGEIHSDLERGFICAEVFNCNDIFAAGSEQKLKDTGKIRREGQDYIMQDGDLVEIRFNV
jgi:GTP-binding protein YchF